MGAAHHRGSSRQDYATPWELIHAVEHSFGSIRWDLAASAKNAKAQKWIATDSLQVQWHTLHPAGWLWLNPPYSNITPWAHKCADEAALGAKIAFLVPASVGSKWFAKYVHRKALVLALTPRINFDGKHPYPKDVILAMYSEEPGFDVWEWR